MTENRRVAFVTGGAGSFGSEIARRLDADGCRVVVADIDADRADAVAAELHDGVGLQLDLASESSVRSGIASVGDRLGRLDVLVNNAGIAPQGDTGTTTTEDFDRTVAINLRGAFLTCSAAWSMLIASPSPRVVMTGSRTWLAGGNPAYSATKAGLIGLCRSVTQDLAPYGGTCNVVAPGPVDTPFVDAMGFGDTRGPAFVRYAAMTPLKRLATPQDIAEAVAFFASDRASFITGDILNVAGGLHLAPKL